MKRPLITIGGGVKFFDRLKEFNVNFKNFGDVAYNAFDSVYDSIFGLRWNGGRICEPKDTVDVATLLLMIKVYNKMGIKYNFSFTNLLLEEEDLDDGYCNLLLEEISGPDYANNGVIVASEMLKKYIKNTYPSLKITHSVCNGTSTLKDYNNATNDPDNDIVVLHPDFNHDLKFLSQLENKEKYEIIINDYCAFGCPYRREHYNLLSKYALLQSRDPIIHRIEELDITRHSSPYSECIAVRNGFNKDGRNVLTFEDIDNLLDIGFRYFKLTGREYDWNEFGPVVNKYCFKYWVRTLVKEAKQNTHI